LDNKKEETFQKIQKKTGEFISALVKVAGSYQDAMFLFLSVLATNNIRDQYLYDGKYVTQYQVCGFNKGKDSDTFDVYISQKNYHAWGGHSGAAASLECSSQLFVDSYKKDENGQWVLLQTSSINRAPRMFWSI
jgi:hypothetical protein